MFKITLESTLRFLASRVIKKYQPKVIGISGSVGKTTTKEAVLLVLAKKYSVRGNIKNYNNEIGLPLTILGETSPGRSLLGWLRVFWRSFLLLVFTNKNYPEVLVLEMGIDRPGDMDYLLSFVPVDIGIITIIGLAHLEFFTSQKQIAQEKWRLIDSLPEQGVAIFNIDDPLIDELARQLRGSVISYGFGPLAELRATNLKINYQVNQEFSVASLNGLSFDLNYKQEVAKVNMSQTISQASVYSALAAAAVGVNQGVSLLDIVTALADFKSPVGRLNLLAGNNKTILIDDSYNASPTSVVEALNVLSQMPTNLTGQRIAVLGEMLELGVSGAAEHRRLGQIIADQPIDQLFLIGPLAKLIGLQASQSGWSGQAHYLDSSTEKVNFKQLIPPGSVILLKGSQGSRVERITKQLLLEQDQSKYCLVRQENHWLNS